jgi:3-hydroxyacyl-CoA dehydrogenase/3-hydroxy-2-methylbutyryl-CoA dehydrogenase
LQPISLTIPSSASGLGLGVVHQIVKSGGSVAILDRDSAAGEKIVEEVGPESCKFYTADVSSTDSIATAVGGIVEWIKSSGRPLGGVVTAAGIGIGTLAISQSGQSLNLRDSDTVFGVNVRGSIDLATQLLPHWTQNGDTVEGDGDNDRGAIIFVSSIVAFEGTPGMTAYSASKGAIMAAVLPLARDLSVHRIRVVSIAPGVFETPLFARLPEPVKADNMRAIAFPQRAGDPSRDFAPFVAHIFENVYINGTTLRLDGGKLTRRLWSDILIDVIDRNAYAVAELVGVRSSKRAESDTIFLGLCRVLLISKIVLSAAASP